MIPRFASRRDPRSRVEAKDGMAVRRFDETGAHAFRVALQGGVVTLLQEKGLMVPHEVIGEDPLEIATPMVPFVSYPPEWSPEMLREAGLLTLDVAITLWNSGFHLRDANAYNVVFDGATPVFVDFGSIGLGHTNLWTAYSQFCDHFLTPLLVESHLRIPFRSLWTLEGVPLSVAAPMFRGTSRYRKGVMTNVILRKRLEAGHANDTLEERENTRSSLSLSESSILRLMEKMRLVLSSLKFPTDSTWGAYESDNSYNDEQQLVRDRVIADFAASGGERSVAVDVGANTGRHSALLASRFDRVIAVDVDDVAVETHRQRLIESSDSALIFAIVGDVADPTAPAGFMSEERFGLMERLSGSDAAIWMAVIHHLVVGRSIPLTGIAEMAKSIAPRHLIEFVDSADPMVQLLSASKNGEHHEYSKEAFLDAFSTLFSVSEVGASLATRTIYELERN